MSKLTVVKEAVHGSAEVARNLRKLADDIEAGKEQDLSYITDGVVCLYGRQGGDDIYTHRVLSVLRLHDALGMLEYTKVRLARSGV